jgi:hypothetical protein
MATLDNLPPLSSWATAGLVGLLLVFWLGMRIRILRGRQARRGPDEAPVPAPRWMRALADEAWILPVLAALGAGCAALLALSF